MKKKIKLRDLTKEQYETWLKNHCDFKYCDKCPFRRIYCVSTNDLSWIKNKDLYSNKLLDQEIEIEVEDKDETLLTKKEKEYLEAVIRPFKDKVEYITKYCLYKEETKEYIYIHIKNDFPTQLPNFKSNKYYKGLERTKRYTLKDLGLFQTKYKITLTEFWNSEDLLTIHCNTEEKANKLLKAFNKLGKRRKNKSSYLEYNFYEVYKDKTCYSNDSQYGNVSGFKKDNFIIYEFDEVDLEK